MGMITNPQFYKTEEAAIPQSQGDCNNCKHNGTWACLKCHGFDKYERAT